MPAEDRRAAEPSDPGARTGTGSRKTTGPREQTGSRESAEPGAPAAGPAQPSGPDLARAVLDAARVKRLDQPRKRGVARGAGRRLRGYSGPGPDPRDPQPFGALLSKLVKTRGWERPAAEARLFGMWTVVVGADLADHCRPVKLEGGELTIEAESTAWATQIRLLSRSLLVRIAGDLGTNVVTKISVHGPVSPSWVKGPKRVRGRGPRDTYG